MTAGWVVFLVVAVVAVLTLSAVVVAAVMATAVADAQDETAELAAAYDRLHQRKEHA